MDSCIRARTHVFLFHTDDPPCLLNVTVEVIALRLQRLYTCPSEKIYKGLATYPKATLAQDLQQRKNLDVPRVSLAVARHFATTTTATAKEAQKLLHAKPPGKWRSQTILPGRR